MKKRILCLFVLLALLLSLGGCADKKSDTEGASGDTATLLKVGATPVPHAEILNFIQDELLTKGVKLEIVEFTDYVTPNLALNSGEIDANFFQHVPYMDTFAENNDIELLALAKVHVEPIGLYSKKIKRLADLKEGATIAIPNDPTNGGRALLLLENHAIITLKPGASLSATEKDIAQNPKKLKFVALEAPQLPRALEDVDAAVINTNYGMEANLNPLRDALIIEDENSPYANVITVNPRDKDKTALKVLVEVLNSQPVKDFILTEYEGAIVPAF